MGSTPVQTYPETQAIKRPFMPHNVIDLEKSFNKKRFFLENSLNVCVFNVGKIDSPYFFNILTQENQMFLELESKISEIRRSKYKFLVPKNTQQQVIALSKRFTQYRYSPLYFPDAGIKTINNIESLMNRLQFEYQWNIRIEPAIPKFQQFLQGINSRLDIEIIKNELKQFDFMCYHGILSYIYNSKTGDCPSNNFYEIIHSNILPEYKGFQKKVFTLTLCDKEQRAKKLGKFIENSQADIILLQEVDSETFKYLIKYTKNYRFSFSYHYLDEKEMKQKEFIQERCPAIGIRHTLGEKLMLDNIEGSLTLKQHNVRHLMNNINLQRMQSEHFQLKQQESRMSKQMSYQDKNVEGSPENKKSSINLFKTIQKTESSGILPQLSKLSNVSHRISSKRLDQKLEELDKSEQISKMDIHTVFDKFQFIQFFGGLIMISHKAESYEKNIKEVLMGLKMALIHIQQKFSSYNIVLGLSVDLLMSCKTVNPMYIHQLFTCSGQHKKQTGLKVYPQFKSSNIKSNKIFISYNNGDIINQEIFTVNKRYPEYHFSNESGSNQIATKEFLITNMELKGSEICTVDRRVIKSEKQLIPNTYHPFNHYLIHSILIESHEMKQKIEEDEQSLEETELGGL